MAWRIVIATEGRGAGGDAIWIARSKRDPRREWVLDYIVERKGVADLLSSIKYGRYEQQKYWMKRCGLRHLMYLVEGKPEDLPEGELMCSSLQIESGFCPWALFKGLITPAWAVKPLTFG